MSNSGGPVFPVLDVGKTQCHGLSCRDYFAACALPAVVAACRYDTLAPGETYEQMIARKCYAIADAMLAHEAKP